LVVFDTTRADHLSAYGYAKPTTPRLEVLAERGARFDGVRSVSSLTPVSAASFLTGQLPTKTGIHSLFLFSGNGLAPEVTPLAELLADAGRATAGFVSAPPMGHRYGFERGFDVFDDDVKEHAASLRAQKIGNAYQRRADATTDRALAWLEARAPGAEPFGLLVHFFDAHDPSLVPPRRFLEPRVSFELPADLDQRGHLADLFDGAEPGRGGPRAADLVELYDAEIEYMDLQLGRLLDALEARGELANTLVVVLADHGESLGQHDFWTHGLLWDEQLHVPLILAGPGVLEGGRLRDSVSLVDLVPSLIELLDLERPARLSGRSFTRLFDPESAATFVSRPAFSEVHNSPGDKTGRPPALFAVTALPWKLILEPGAEPKLFDLEADPAELVDLGTEDHPAARALLEMLDLSGLRGDGGASAPASLDDLDPAEREMLEKLGYL
jgi:arylsulfatase A-like enzyme